MNGETRSQRLRRYVREYSAGVWPDMPIPLVSEGDLDVLDVWADSYANAHVEGEHEANGICQFESATECGERWAAAEFVECN